MNESYDQKQVQETLQRTADEFLALYLQSSHINGFCFVSRLFVMGHTLELYVKSFLSGTCNIRSLGSHRLYQYVADINVDFALPDTVIEAGRKLFSPDIRNFEIGLQLKYAEELELYLIYYHLADLKYYISRDGRVIFPVVTNTIQFNKHFLSIVGTIRRAIPIPNRSFADDRLKGLIKYLGIDNPQVEGIF